SRTDAARCRSPRAEAAARSLRSGSGTRAAARAPASTGPCEGRAARCAWEGWQLRSLRERSSLLLLLTEGLEQIGDDEGEADHQQDHRDGRAEADATGLAEDVVGDEYGQQL